MSHDRSTIVARIDQAGLAPERVTDLVNRTLDEDLQWGPDVTTNAIFDEQQTATARVTSRADGCLAGVWVGALTQHLMAERTGQSVDTTVLVDDGATLHPGTAVLEITAPLRVLLTAERTMLNLMGQLSGVATATAAWVAALSAGATKVRDTRKTVPGMRELQKYAVRCGGGVNHRMGLGDAALIKDNHVAAAGSVTAAIEAVRAIAPDIVCEVECDTLDQVSEAVAAGAKLVLLDNMNRDQMAEAVAICAPAGVATEASGGLVLAAAAGLADLGLSYVAVGALTHSAAVLDLGLDAWRI